MKKLLSLLLVAWLAPGLMSAQTYVVEGLYRDCAKAHEHTPGKSLLSRINPFNAFKGEKEIMLPNGTEVTLLSDKAYRMVSVEYEGEEWQMDARELRFAESNPAGTVDVLAGIDFSPAPIEMTELEGEKIYVNTMQPGTAEWRVLHSATIPLVVVLLVVLTGVLIFLVARDDYSAKDSRWGKLTVWLASLLIAVIGVLELWYLLRMGKESYWWCSVYYYPKWGAAFRWVLFALIVVGQWILHVFYYTLLNNTVHKRIVGGRIGTLLFTIVAIVAGFFIALSLYPEAKAEQSLEAMQPAWRAWAGIAVSLSLVFPIIYMSVKLRNPLKGVVVGVGTWAYLVGTVMLSLRFLGATWTMLKIILLPLFSLVFLLIILSFISKFKPVNTSRTVYITDEDGNRRARTIHESTLEYDDKGSLFKKD